MNSTDGPREPALIHRGHDILVLSKPPGMPVQVDPTGDLDLLTWARKEFKEPALQLVNRIDRPVSGLVLLANEGETLVAVNRAFQDRDVHKVYLAIVEGKVVDDEVLLEHHIEHDARSKRARVVAADAVNARAAMLRIRVLAKGDRYTLIEVRPEGGRFHQIRVQLAAWGHPIKGDVKYGARRGERDRSIALHAHRMALPSDLPFGQWTFTAPPPSSGLWAVLWSPGNNDHIGSTSVTN